MGTERASRLYAGLMTMTYICIVGGVLSKFMPPLSLIALLSIPFAWKAVRTAFKYHDNLQGLIPALKANVITILLTDALLALAYFLS